MKTRKLYDCFERDTRTDGTEFVKVKDDAPEWLLDAVRECQAIASKMLEAVSENSGEEEDDAAE